MSDSKQQVQNTGRQVKVARLLDKYEFGSIGKDLERMWTEEGEERRSLRDLAKYFNCELLKQVMAEAGVQPLDGEIENLYRLLTADEVSEAEQVRTIRRLEKQGVDVDSLTDDFVTYQAVRTYLKNVRDVEYSPSKSDPIKRKTGIRRLQGRTAEVTKQTLEGLQNDNQLSIGDFRTIVNINVICDTCGRQYEVGELIDQGRCGCAVSSDAA